jgi:hypothetical protein
VSVESLKILSICSEYAFSSVYKNLVAKLDRRECRQTVYILLRLPELEGRNKLTGLAKTNYVYSRIYSLLDGVDLVHAYNETYLNRRQKT